MYDAIFKRDDQIIVCFFDNYKDNSHEIGGIKVSGLATPKNIYEEFKIENGFTLKEIINKKKSLKGILEPFSSKANLDMLKRAGFIDMSTVGKYLSFEFFLAIK